MRRPLLFAGFVAFATFAAPTPVVIARESAGLTLDESVPAGRNFDKAEFRLWLPPGDAPVRAIVALVPGSNGDWRDQVANATWQAFATKQHLALVGLRLTDKTHPQGFIEEYVDVSQGSGQAFLDAVGRFATKSKHAELATVPFLLWGMSAGGEFNYEFNAWKPERVLGFVVNKGNIYYSALVSKAARDVPGLLFVGGKDLDFRVNTIAGLFAVNRRGGALWAFASEPEVGHAIGKSQDVSMMFFDDMLQLRLGDAGALKPLDEAGGFRGDPKTGQYQAATGPAPQNALTAWMPTERVARAWQAMITGQPISR